MSDARPRFRILIDTAAPPPHHARTVPRRLPVILLVLYQAVFLNVFIPVHTRGQITLDDRTPKTPATSPHLTRAGCCTPNSSSRPSDPTPADRANCAVCHLAAHYTPPPVADLRPEPLGFAHLLEATATQAPVTLTLSLPYHGRAPPASA